MLKAGNHGGGDLDVRQEKAVGPLISVLMPVRNGVTYIGEAIDSIIDQTLMDWELVIIDNASTDGTGAYVKRRAARDPRIVFQGNEVDSGEAADLSAGLALCRGEWIACMDAGDRATPNRLERQLAFMLQNRDVAVVSCLARYINSEGELMPAIALDAQPHEADECSSRRDDIMRVLHRCAFTRRETLARVAGHRAKEVDLMNLLAEDGTILVQPEYLMQYRIDSSSQPARLFDLANHAHGWAENCILARRSCTAELRWEPFSQPQSSAQSGPKTERYHHRESGELGTSSHMLTTALRIAREFALRPAFGSVRLGAQLLRRGGASPLEAGEA